jgi:glycosyltransferase involved in cell wall biosynthesis
MTTRTNVLIYVTCRNYECYIQEALHSARGQTWKSTVWTSHDDCGGSHPIGAAANRNRVLTSAATVRTFDHVVFLDADDILPPNYVEELLKESLGSRSVVCCDAEMFGDRTGFIRCNPDPQANRWGNTIHNAALIGMEAFREVNGYDEMLPAYEDWDMWRRMMAAQVPFRRTSAVRLRYRFHGESRNRMDKATEEALRQQISQKYEAACSTR